MMLLCLGFVAFGGDAVLALADRYPLLTVLVGGLLAALGAFGELPATIGGSDGPNIGLSMVAGVRAGAIVMGKWVACLPLAVLSFGCTWAVSVAVGRPGVELGLAAGFVGLGFGVVALAGGLFDLDPHAEATEREVPAILRLLRRAPVRGGSGVGVCTAARGRGTGGGWVWGGCEPGVGVGVFAPEAPGNVESLRAVQGAQAHFSTIVPVGRDREPERFRSPMQGAPSVTPANLHRAT